MRDIDYGSGKLGGIAMNIQKFTQKSIQDHLPIEAVLYPASICGALGLMLLGIDFRRVLMDMTAGAVG